MTCREWGFPQPGDPMAVAGMTLVTEKRAGPSFLPSFKKSSIVVSRKRRAFGTENLVPI